MPPRKLRSRELPCPCGSIKSLQNCCLTFIEGKAQAPTAELLMRSRYTAHVLVAIDYLWDTWSAEERIHSSKAAIKAWAESCEWLGLQILSTEAGQIQDAQGIVSFIAFFKYNNQLEQHHETSLFTKTDQGWRYVNHRD